MTQLQNQFSQSVVKGMPDLRISSTTIACEVEENVSTPLVAGQAVKMVDTAGGVPKVEACAADSDLLFGFISYNIKQASFAAQDAVEIAMDGGVLFLEAGAAIARQGQVMLAITGEKVVTATTSKPVAGIALDKAAADGDLIRVYVKSFGLDLAL